MGLTHLTGLEELNLKSRCVMTKFNLLCIQSLTGQSYLLWLLSLLSLFSTKIRLKANFEFSTTEKALHRNKIKIKPFERLSKVFQEFFIVKQAQKAKSNILI